MNSSIIALRVAGRPIDALANHLGDRAVLLVLDNCEHVVSACASLCDALLQACDTLQILATRELPRRAISYMNAVTIEPRWGSHLCMSCFFEGVTPLEAPLEARTYAMTIGRSRMRVPKSWPDMKSETIRTIS